MPNDSRKAAALKRSSARSAGRTRASLMKPGPVVESGTAVYSAVRLAQAALRNAASAVKTSKGRTAKQKTVTGPFGQEVVRTKRSAKRQAQARSAVAQNMKGSIKRGGIQQPSPRADKYGAPNPISSRMRSVQVKPSSSPRAVSAAARKNRRASEARKAVDKKQRPPSNRGANYPFHYQAPKRRPKWP